MKPPCWYIVASQFGRFAEWLGAGLQNQLQRFESATDLNYNSKPANFQRVLFLALLKALLNVQFIFFFGCIEQDLIEYFGE